MREPLRPTRYVARSAAIPVAILALAAAALSGCSGTPVSEPIAQAAGAAPVVAVPAEWADVPITADVVYDEATGQAVDVCTPVDASSDTLLPAVLVVHGGSWARGDKADPNWRPLCQWLAAEGFVAVSVNYRLAPEAVFPTQIDDVSAALDFLLAPEQTGRFGIDPERVAAFGGSAGGNLVSMLGTREATASRLAAVVDLSGPSDLTAAGLADDDAVVGVAGAVRTYLGCADHAACPAAAEASPLAHVDGSEPPFFIAHSEEERVALSQSSAFAEALEASGASVDFVVVPGALHSIAMLDDSLRGDVVDFLHEHLDVPEVQTLSLEPAGAADPAS